MTSKIIIIALALFSLTAQAEVLNCQSVQNAGQSIIVDTTAGLLTTVNFKSSHSLVEYDPHFQQIVFNAKETVKVSITYPFVEFRTINNERTDVIVGEGRGRYDVEQRLELYAHGQDIYVYDGVRDVVSCK